MLGDDGASYGIYAAGNAALIVTRASRWLKPRLWASERPSMPRNASMILESGVDIQARLACRFTHCLWLPSLRQEETGREV